LGEGISFQVIFTNMKQLSIMQQLSILLFAGMLFFASASAQVPLAKFDSTLKFGKTGYRVDCKNKNYDENQLTVRPIGFEGGAREVSFMIRGRVAKAEIDDLNSDGYPDLVVYIFNDSNAIFGTVFAFISEANKSISPLVLPDPMMDGKINEGYKGHDQFSLMQGYLMEKFPIYKAGDDKDKPTGGTRVLLYQLAKKEGGGYKFDQVRHYDSH
jgi:hypothetical protein